MDLATANEFCKNTLISNLGIVITEAKEGYMKATMPVDERTIQPFRLLHGGASAALAETVGSLGSQMLINQKTEATVGIEINANHLKSAKSGLVTAVAELVHKGRKMHVWNIEITNEDGGKVSVCRLTNMIIEKRG